MMQTLQIAPRTAAPVTPLQAGFAARQPSGDEAEQDFSVDDLTCVTPSLPDGAPRPEKDDSEPELKEATLTMAAAADTDTEPTVSISAFSGAELPARALFPAMPAPAGALPADQPPAPATPLAPRDLNRDVTLPLHWEAPVPALDLAASVLFGSVPVQPEEGLRKTKPANLPSGEAPESVTFPRSPETNSVEPLATLPQSPQLSLSAHLPATDLTAPDHAVPEPSTASAKSETAFHFLAMSGIQPLKSSPGPDNATIEASPAPWPDRIEHVRAKTSQAPSNAAPDPATDETDRIRSADAPLDPTRLSVPPRQHPEAAENAAPRHSKSPVPAGFPLAAPPISLMPAPSLPAARLVEKATPGYLPPVAAELLLAAPQISISHATLAGATAIPAGHPLTGTAFLTDPTRLILPESSALPAETAEPSLLSGQAEAVPKLSGTIAADKLSEATGKIEKALPIPTSSEIVPVAGDSQRARSALNAFPVSNPMILHLAEVWHRRPPSAQSSPAFTTDALPSRLADQPTAFAPAEGATSLPAWGEPDKDASLSPFGGSLAGAPASRESAAVAPRPDLPPHFSARIAEAAFSARDGVTELRLAPDELGSVRIELRTEGEKVSITILAERQETLELMRRHADRLAAEMRSAGFAEMELGFGNGNAMAQGFLPEHGADAGQPAAEDLTAPSEIPPAAAHSLRNGSALYLRL